MFSKVHKRDKNSWPENKIVRRTEDEIYMFKGVLYFTPGFDKDKLYCALPLSEQKRNNIKRRESSGCGLPMLDPFDASIMDYVQLLPRLHCEGTLFTSYHDNTLKIIATHDRGIVSYFSPQSPPDIALGHFLPCFLKGKYSQFFAVEKVMILENWELKQTALGKERVKNVFQVP